MFVLRARRDHALGFGQQRIEVELLEIEPDAAGLDLGHVENVVDDVEQVLPAAEDVAAIFAILVGAERAEHARLHDLGKPDDGIERRAQLVAHIGEEFRFGLVGLLGTGLFGGILLGQFGQPLLRGAHIGDRRHQPFLAVDQLFLVRLERGNVGADRDIAAVLGAPLADVQPAAVLELRLEGARAGNIRAAGDGPAAHHRLAAGLDHGFVRRADRDRLVGQIVQLLKIRIAQHQTIIGIPYHEGFRDSLDGIAQAHVRGHRLFDQILLLGDVDRDADQTRARLARLAHQLATRAQPDPMAVGVAHAEGMIDGGRRGFGDLRRQVVEPQVVRMGERADVAERQQAVLGREPENLEHRLRPEDAPARQVPIPQAAAAAIERGIDAAANRFVDQVRFACPCRLPVEGKAEDQHDEAGGSRECYRERGERAPGRQRHVTRLQDGDLPERGFQHVHGRQRAAVIGQSYFHDAGVGAEGGEQLRGPEQVDQAVADGGVGGRRGGRHHALRIGQEEAPPGGGGPERQRACEHLLRTGLRVGGLLERLLQALGGDFGDGIERDHHVVKGLPAVVEHLHGGADANGGEKRDDEHRNGAAQQGLSGQQAPIRRLGDRLRETLNGI